VATNAELKRAAERWLEQYGQRVADMLGLTMKDVNITIGKTEGDALAETRGTDIIISPKWDPRNAGLVVHELVHAYQDLGDADVPPKLIEAMADAVRSRLGLDRGTPNDPGGWEASPRAAKLADLRPQQLQALAAKMAGGATAADLAAEYGNSVMNAISGIFGGGSGDGGDYETTQPPGGGGDGDENKGPTKKEKEYNEQQRKDLRSGFINAIREFGIPMTQNIQQLISAGVGDKYNYDRFLRYLRQTPEYRQAFPGIFNEDGSLKMSEDQYLANKVQYEQYASRYGVNLSEGKIAWLFKNDVDPSEFADRAPAVTRLRENKDLYTAFKKELVDSGLAKPKDVEGNKEMFRFVMGAGNQAWYDLWQDAATRYTANEAGITFAKNRDAYTNLNQRIIERVSAKGLTEEAMSTGFQEVAEQLLTVLPLSQLQGYGLTKRDLVTAQFGGKGSARIRQLAERVIKQEEAFYENRAATPTYATAEGVETLGGEKKKAQTY
jgi:hypothetical protein